MKLTDELFDQVAWRFKALGEPAIRAAFLAACRAELGALKPGNVHIHGGGHASAAVRGTTVAEKLKMSVRVPGNPLTERLVQKPRRRQGEYPARPHTA